MSVPYLPGWPGEELTGPAPMSSCGPWDAPTGMSEHLKVTRNARERANKLNYVTRMHKNRTPHNEQEWHSPAKKCHSWYISLAASRFPGRRRRCRDPTGRRMLRKLQWTGKLNEHLYLRFILVGKPFHVYTIIKKESYCFQNIFELNISIIGKW